MRSSVALLSMTLVACGRLEFELRTDAAPSDGAGDDIIQLTDCPRGMYCLETVPTTVDLFSVWARSADDVYAVGRGGVVLRRTGGVWRQIVSMTTNDLYAVWAAPDSDLVIAVGENAMRIRLRGDTFEAGDAGGMGLNGLWGSASDRVFAVGELGTVSRWNGSMWTSVTGATGSLSAVWGTTTPNDVWISSVGQDLFHSVDDAPFITEDPPPNSDDWFGGWSASPTDVWVVGYTNHRFNGSAWTELPTELPFTAVFDSVHGLDGGVWFVGSEGIAVHDNGSIRPVFSSPLPLLDVHGAGGVMWFVGAGGTIYVHQP